MNEVIMYFDGGIRSGQMALGFVVYENDEFHNPTGSFSWNKDLKDKELFYGNRKCGRGSSNIAEYRALIAGLMECLKREVKIVHIYGDSQLIIKQITGASRTNNKDLVEHRDKVIELLELFENYSVKWIPRQYNKRADELVNEIFKRYENKAMKKIKRNKNEKQKSNN